MTNPAPGFFTRAAHILFLDRFRNTGDNGNNFMRASTWVAMISAIVGGFIGLSTYRLDVSKKVDESVAKTFEMIGTYNSGDIRDARDRTLSYVYARRECDSRIMNRELSDDDFVRLLEFYDLVHACVDAGLCDAATAQKFFGPHANFQWPVLSRIVDEMRVKKSGLRSDANFGVGMKTLATEPVPAPPCDGNF